VAGVAENLQEASISFLRWSSPPVLAKVLRIKKFLERSSQSVLAEGLRMKKVLEQGLHGFGVWGIAHLANHHPSAE